MRDDACLCVPPSHHITSNKLSRVITRMTLVWPWRVNAEKISGAPDLWHYKLACCVSKLRLHKAGLRGSLQALLDDAFAESRRKEKCGYIHLLTKAWPNASSFYVQQILYHGKPGLYPSLDFFDRNTTTRVNVLGSALWLWYSSCDTWFETWKWSTPTCLHSFS